MTRVRETMGLEMPAAQAEAAILAFFEAYRDREGEIRFPLSVPLHDFGLQDDLEVERRVVVSAEKRRDADNLNDEIALSWRPARDGWYPHFNGVMRVWSEDEPARCFVEIDGTYAPPLGTAGRIFDAAIGELIARRTLHHLLESIRDGIAAPSAARGH